jgi:hypothetical protein
VSVIVKTFVAFWFAFVAVFVFPSAEAFVFLGPHKPRLKPVDGRVVKFALTNEAPAFVDRVSYADGYFDQLSDAETFELLVAEAMRLWNEIPGLSVELAIDTEAKGVIDPADGIFSIGIGEISTQASGLAFPVESSSDPTEIVDCDIEVARDVVSIPSFVYVMVHELGHCLGLGHNHSDPTAIMGYWQPVNEIALGSDDIAGVLSLYPPAGSEPLDTLAPCGSLAAPRSLEQRLKRGQQSNTLAYVFFLLPCAVIVLFRFFRTWSFRRRRQKFVL